MGIQASSAAQFSPDHYVSHFSRLVAKHNVKIAADKYNDSIFSGDFLVSFVGVKAGEAGFYSFKPLVGRMG